MTQERGGKVKLMVILLLGGIGIGCAGPGEIAHLKHAAESRNMYWVVESQDSGMYCADAYIDPLKDQWIDCGLSEYGAARAVANMLESNAPSSTAMHFRSREIASGDARKP